MIVDKSVETLNPSVVWEEIVGSIRAEVSADTFDRWFKETELVALNDETLTLRVPNNIYQLWIESNYLNLLQSSTLLALGSPRAVQFTYGDNESAPPSAPVGRENLPAPEEDDKEEEADFTPQPFAHGLNPRNTFESF